MNDWIVVSSSHESAWDKRHPMRSNNLKEFLAYLASDYPEAIVTSSWVAREFRKNRIAARDYPVLPEILTILAKESDLDNLSYEDARARVASKNWAYLNGQVLFGDAPHLLLRELAKQQETPTANYIASAWLSGTGTPHGSEHSVAHGEILPTGHVSIYNSNTDRNTVRDAVENSHRTAATRQDYEGTLWNNDHITRVEEGNASPAVLANLMGVKGEYPGEHRNKQGDNWTQFVQDIRTNGVREPLFITVNAGQRPKISEGNHRRDAAIEAGLESVPVHIRYFGHAERGVGDWAKLSKDWQIVSDWQVVAKADYDGQMVSLDLPAGIASAMAVPGGEPTNAMHLTIAYMDKGMKNPAEVKRIVHEVANEFGPIQAQVDKLEEFPESNDGDIPVVALVKGDKLEQLHEAVKAGLKGIGESISEKFDFKPHITLEYIKPGSTFKGKDPTGISITFPSLNLHDGGEVEEFQFGEGSGVKDNAFENAPAFAFSGYNYKIDDWHIVNGT